MKEFIKNLFVYVWLVLTFGFLSFLIFNISDENIFGGWPFWNIILAKSFITAVVWAFLFVPVKKEIEKLSRCFFSRM